MNKAADGSESVKHVKRMLYHRMNVVPQKKVMTFNRHAEDFKFHACYTELDFLNEEEQRYGTQLDTYWSLCLLVVEMSA